MFFSLAIFVFFCLFFLVAVILRNLPCEMSNSPGCTLVLTFWAEQLSDLLLVIDV